MTQGEIIYWATTYGALLTIGWLSFILTLVFSLIFWIVVISDIECDLPSKISPRLLRGVGIYSLVVLMISILIIVFVPSQRQYLTMKLKDPQLVARYYAILDSSATTGISNTSPINSEGK